MRLYVSLFGALLIGMAVAQPAWNTTKSAKAGYYSSSVQLPSLSAGPTQSAASAAAKAWASGQNAEFLTSSNSQFKQYGKPTAAYTFMIGPTKAAIYQSPRLTSFALYISEYQGGAHPSYASKTFTYGLMPEGVRVLALRDLFAPGTDVYREVNFLLIEKLLKNPAAMFVGDGSVKDLGASTLENFVVTPTGLTFLIDPYTAGPWSSGSFYVPISVAELGPSFKRSMIFGR